MGSDSPRDHSELFAAFIGYFNADQRIRYLADSRNGLRI